MVPTHILLAAMAALADPTPAPSPSPHEGPMLVINGEQMKFIHPVATNPYMPAAQSKAPHTDQPKKSGSGGRGGSGGGSGSSGSSGTSSSQSSAELAAALAAAQKTNGTSGGTGTPGQTGTSGGTGSQPTDPSNPTVLPNPTDQTTAAMMPTSDLFAQSTSSPTSSSAGMAAVVPDAFDPPVNSPVSTPEPGTIFLFVVGATVGGGAAVKKWLRRKK